MSTDLTKKIVAQATRERDEARAREQALGEGLARIFTTPNEKALTGEELLARAATVKATAQRAVVAANLLGAKLKELGHCPGCVVAGTTGCKMCGPVAASPA